MINWKVRIKNRLFWISFIPAVILVIQANASLLGYDCDFTTIQENLIAVVNAVFGLLAVMGIVNDPTTEGLQDSRLARTYTEPKEKED